MKSITLGIIVVSFPLWVFAFVPKHSATYYEAIKPEVQEAQRKGAKAKIIYRIVDDDGTPITNATVCGQWQNDYPSSASQHLKARSIVWGRQRSRRQDGTRNHPRFSRLNPQGDNGTPRICDGKRRMRKGALRQGETRSCQL